MRDKDTERYRILSESDLTVFGPVPKLRGEVDSAAGTVAGTPAPVTSME